MAIGESLDNSEPVDNDFIIPPEFKGRKIICRIWSDNGKNATPMVLAKKKIKYGQPDFSVKIGGKMRMYKMNYRTKGLIKQDGKFLYYDIHFSNALGGLVFYEFNEDVDSEEAYTVFKNNAVNMYVKKGGIPAILLYVSFIALIIMAVALAYVSPTTINMQTQVKELDTQITTLKQQNAILQQQLNNALGVR